MVDLCCGTGKGPPPLVERGLTVVGIDVSREMLRVYRRKCRDSGNPILIHADASRPPLRQDSCLALSMIGGLHHIPDRIGSLEFCCAALSQGGLLILHEPLKTGRHSRLARLLEKRVRATDPARVWAAFLPDGLDGAKSDRPIPHLRRWKVPALREAVHFHRRADRGHAETHADVDLAVAGCSQLSSVRLSFSPRSGSLWRRGCPPRRMAESEQPERRRRCALCRVPERSTLKPPASDAVGPHAILVGHPALL